MERMLQIYSISVMYTVLYRKRFYAKLVWGLFSVSSFLSK